MAFGCCDSCEFLSRLCPPRKLGVSGIRLASSTEAVRETPSRVQKVVQPYMDFGFGAFRFEAKGLGIRVYGQSECKRW